MGQPFSVSVPIEHCRRVHEIEPEIVADPDAVTLRELVEAVSECSASEQEVVAAVVHMLRSGRVKLHGVYEEPATAKLCG